MQRFIKVFASAICVGVACLTGCEGDGQERDDRSAGRAERSDPMPGQLSQTVAGSVEDVIMASRLALNGLNMLEVRGNTVAGREGMVTARTPDGDPIVIDIRRRGFERSRFSVRVGERGDPELAAAIQGRIIENLRAGIATTTIEDPANVVDEHEALPPRQRGGSTTPAPVGTPGS